MQARRIVQPAAMSPWVAKFLHVRRTELNRTLQVAGFAIVLGWAMYTAFSAAQSIFLNKAGPQAYPLFFIVLALAVWPMVDVEAQTKALWPELEKAALDVRRGCPDRRGTSAAILGVDGQTVTGSATS